MSLRTRLLVILILVIMIPSYLVSRVIFSNVETILIQQQGEQLDVIAQAKEQQVSQFFRGKINFLEIIASESELKEYLLLVNEGEATAEDTKEIEEYLAREVRSSSSFSSIAVYLDSELVTSTYDVTEGDVGFTQTVLAEYKANGSKAFFYNPLLQYVYILLDAPDELGLDAVLVQKIHIQEITRNIVDYYGLGETGEILLAQRGVSGDAEFIHERRFEDDERTLTSISKENLRVPVVQALLHNETILFDANDYRNEPVVAATRYLPDLDWGIVVKKDLVEIENELNRIENIFFIVTVMIIAVSGLIAFVIASSIVSPLVTLTQITQKLSKQVVGELQFPKRFLSDSSELGVLTRSFQKMAESIYHSKLTLENQVSERTQQLMQNQELFLKAEQVAHVGSWQYNFDTEEMIWSDEMFRIHGLRPEQIKPTFEKLLKFVHVDDQPSDISALEKAVELGKKYEIEKRIVLPDKTIKFVRAEAKLLGEGELKNNKLVGSYLDITETKKAEERLRSSKERFKIAFDSAPIGMVLLSLDGRFKDANSAFLELFSFSEKEIETKSFNDIFHPDSVQEGEKTLMEYVEERKESFSLERECLRNDGSSLWIRLYGSLVRSSEDSSQQYIIQILDITEQRKVDKMKTEFISLASHQLRTPLSAIKWFMQMLFDGDAGEFTDEQLEYLRNINKSNERMIELVNGLLNISRIESGRIIIEPEETDVRALIDEVLRELKPKQEEKSISLQVDISDDVPRILIDPKLIRNVYTNLLTNAIKYTPNDGTVSLNVFVKDDNLHTVIQDTGVGIPESEQKNVFKKFFRGSNVVKMDTDGTGLGLYLVKSIIEVSGGDIRFTSEEGKGTTFEFTLPLAGTKPKKGEVSLS